VTGKSLNYQKEAGELASPGPGWGRAIRPPLSPRERSASSQQKQLSTYPKAACRGVTGESAEKSFIADSKSLALKDTSSSSRGGSLTAKSLNYRSKAGELTALAQDGGELLSPPPS
jgi:hypothetical protein